MDCVYLKGDESIRREDEWRDGSEGAVACSLC